MSQIAYPSEWTRYKLGDIAKSVVEKVSSNCEDPVYAVTKHAGFVPSTEYFKKQVFSKDTKGYKRVKRGQFAYATIHLDEGSIGLLEDAEAAIISPMYNVFSVDTSKVWPQFLYKLLKSPEMIAKYQLLGTGSVHRRKAISFDRLSKLEIYLPSIAEQKKIVAILDKADAIRRKRQRAIALTEEFLRSAFLEMFGDPVTNPMGLPVKNLDEVCNFFSGGTPSKARVDYWEGKFPWVSPKDMKKREITDAEDHVSDKVFEETSLKKMPLDSVLIVVRGMILAHTIPIAINRRHVAINQDMKALVPKKIILPELLLWNLLSQHDHILSKVATAAHGTKRLEMLELSNMPVLIPEQKDQEKFIGICKKFTKLREALENHQPIMEKLLLALKNKAFQGELTTKNVDELLSETAAG